tara:strand:+ start:203 stop:682 length:480 start_codon:yes stop_codon:yes gene_type:complete
MNLKDKNTLDKAQSVAIKFINYRLRSEQELRVRLLKDFDEPVIKSTISKMYEFKFLDDTRFAKSFTESRINSKPKSMSYIKKELSEKGISKENIDLATKNIDDHKTCHELAAKKSKSLSRLPWVKFQQKMLGYLIRRGFNYSIANSATKKVWEEIQSDF